jgi:cyclophilin family peptidyl-prolyl cis-trans isomerase
VKKLLFALLSGLALVGISARGQVPSPNHTVVRFSVNTFGTNFGTLDIELFDQEKPATVRNFLMYVYSGAYSNLALHSLIYNSMGNFKVLEAGHVRIENPTSSEVFSSYPSWKDFGFITNEYSVGPELSNEFGTIATVRFPGKPDSASYEWAINLTNNLSFNTNDGGVTVFGRVVNSTDARSGTNLLNYFNSLTDSNGLGFVGILDYFEFLFPPISIERDGQMRITDLFTVQPTLIQGGMTRDTTAPTVQVTEPASDIMEAPTPVVTFSGTASDNQEVARVLYDSIAVRSGVATGNSNWTVEVRLGAGTNKVSVRSVDYFGNESIAVERTVFNPFVQMGFTQIGKGKVIGVTNGQFFKLGVTNRLEAKPAPGFRFVGWRGDLFSGSRIIEFKTDDFVGVDGSFTNITAVFGKTFLGLSNGPYSGLFFPTNNSIPRNSGFISFNLTPGGEYIGRLNPIGASYAIRGKFQTDGTSLIVGTRGSDTIALQLFLPSDPSTEIITGRYYYDGVNFSPVVMYKVAKFTSTNPTPLAGTYSFTISPVDNSAIITGDGYGHGSFTIDPLGRIKMTGTLADGTTVKQSGKLLKYNNWPFITLANNGREAVQGWATFGSTNAFSVPVNWWAPHFPGNTNQTAKLSAAPYSDAVRLADWTSGTLTLSGDELEAPVTADVTLSDDGQITVEPNPHNVQFSRPDAKGKITGSFTHPMTGEATPLSGSALQSSNIVAGFTGVKTNNGGFIIRRKP